MRREGEHLVVVDPWDSQVPDTENAAERTHPDVSLEMFKANFQKFHVRPADIRRGISSVCLPALGSSNYRFIHVDGSHEWDQVKADVEQVLRLLGPDGVVAFDDMHVPGVGSAVWPACASGDLIPIANTGKLYATRTSGGVISPEALSDAIQDARGVVVEGAHTIFGHTVLGVSVSSSPEDWGPPPLGGRARNSSHPFSCKRHPGLHSARGLSGTNGAVHLLSQRSQGRSEQIWRVGLRPGRTNRLDPEGCDRRGDQSLRKNSWRGVEQRPAMALCIRPAVLGRPARWPSPVLLGEITNQAL